MGGSRCTVMETRTVNSFAQFLSEYDPGIGLNMNEEEITRWLSITLHNLCTRSLTTTVKEDISVTRTCSSKEMSLGRWSVMLHNDMRKK